jgi:hypothetical protein
MGLILGTYGVILPNRMEEITQHIFRAMIVGTVASYLTACFAGMNHIFALKNYKGHCYSVINSFLTFHSRSDDVSPFKSCPTSQVCCVINFLSCLCVHLISSNICSVPVECFCCPRSEFHKCSCPLLILTLSEVFVIFH